MGSAPSSVTGTRHAGNEISLSKSEVSRVKKLFHQLDSDNKGLVQLSKVTQLPHLKNNVLAKLVASQYVKKQHVPEEEDVTEEECLDVEKFIELFDLLSPKKSVQSKLEVTFAALKDKDSDKITPQGLLNYFKLLLPSGIPPVNLESVVTSLYHQLYHKEDGDSSQHDEMSLENFVKVVNKVEILARLNVQV
ncbi:uncharacterized protein [Dysidea avara]|uniref:uncharacterized protein n=1 Tax=Dysidea avara TaxID=196820 RepID=UPI00333206A2